MGKKYTRAERVEAMTTEKALVSTDIKMYHMVPMMKYLASSLNNQLKIMYSPMIVTTTSIEVL